MWSIDHSLFVKPTKFSIEMSWQHSLFVSIFAQSMCTLFNKCISNRQFNKITYKATNIVKEIMKPAHKTSSPKQQAHTRTHIQWLEEIGQNSINDTVSLLNVEVCTMPPTSNSSSIFIELPVSNDIFNSVLLRYFMLCISSGDICSVFLLSRRSFFMLELYCLLWLPAVLLYFDFMMCLPLECLCFLNSFLLRCNNIVDNWCRRHRHRPTAMHKSDWKSNYVVKQKTQHKHLYVYRYSN